MKSKVDNFSSDSDTELSEINRKSIIKSKSSPSVIIKVALILAALGFITSPVWVPIFLISLPILIPLGIIAFIAFSIFSFFVIAAFITYRVILALCKTNEDTEDCDSSDLSDLSDSDDSNCDDSINFDEYINNRDEDDSDDYNFEYNNDTLSDDIHITEDKDDLYDYGTCNNDDNWENFSEKKNDIDDNLVDANDDVDSDNKENSNNSIECIDDDD